MWYNVYMPTVVDQIKRRMEEINAAACPEVEINDAERGILECIGWWNFCPMEFVRELPDGEQAVSSLLKKQLVVLNADGDLEGTPRCGWMLHYVIWANDEDIIAQAQQIRYALEPVFGQSLTTKLGSDAFYQPNDSNMIN